MHFHHTASSDHLISPPTRLPGRPTSPASLFRCLFSSKESACPPQGPKLPHCHLGLVHPRVSPSTSALSLVLSHRDWKRESAICRASDTPPHRWGRGLGKRQGSPQPWGLGPLCPKAHVLAGASADRVGSSSLPALHRCDVLTVVINPVLNMFKQILTLCYVA